MKPRHPKLESYGFLLIGLTVVGVGIWMIVNDIVGYGTHSLTQQHTGADGHYILIMGLIVLGILFFALSPFHPIRKFFRRLFRKRK